MPLQQITFPLRGEFITLDRLLKACGLAESGGRAKTMVAEGMVQVDGRDELRKTAKIRGGQVVSLHGARIKVLPDPDLDQVSPDNGGLTRGHASPLEARCKADELHLTPLELIDRIAALVPPPRTHRHRYFGVLAPNSPLRAAVTALAQPAASQPATVETAQPGAGVPGVAAPGNAATPTPEPEARPKRAAHYLWAVLIARIYEAFPLLCPMCGGQMRIIAFITHSAEIRHILNHIGVESAPPHITPARGPPLWEGCDAPVDDGAQGEPDWDLAAQPDEVDQRVNW